MKKLATLFIAFSLVFLISIPLAAQSAGDYQTQASGNWSTPGIWKVYTGSAWVNTGTPPDGSQTITILSADSVYVNAPISISGTIIFQGILEPVDSLTITIASGGTFQYDRNEGTMPKCVWASGSTLLLTGITSTAPEDRDQNYYNLVFNTPNLSSNLNMNLNNNTISGDVTVINTGVSRWYLTSAQAMETSVVTILGDVIVQDGQFSVQGTGNALTTFIVHHYGNINVTGGNFSISRGSQGGGTTTWYLYEGDFSMSDAETRNSTSTQGGARFVFAKDNGTQHLTLSNVTYNSNALPVEVEGTTTLDVGSSPIQGSGIFELNAYATLANALPSGVSSSLQTTGAIALSDSANYTFNGTAAQVTGAAMPVIVNDLTIDNTAGVALSQETTINGVLHLVSGVFDNTIPFILGPNGSISYEGGSLLISSIESEYNNIPESFFMDQNYPNPFNPTTTIKFGLPSVSYVTAVVYNVLGEKIATLYEGQLRAGEHRLEFNGDNLTSGVYFLRLQADDVVSMKRMVLVK